MVFICCGGAVASWLAQVWENCGKSNKLWGVVPVVD